MRRGWPSPCVPFPTFPHWTEYPTFFNDFHDLVWTFAYIFLSTRNCLMLQKKNELHGTEPTGRNVKRVSIKKPSQSCFGIRFIRAYFVALVSWEQFYTPCYVVKPTDENNSKHVRSITRCFWLIYRTFLFSTVLHSSIGNFPMAV